MGDDITAAIAALLNQNDERAQRLGKLIEDIQKELQEGKLTQDDFIELMTDVEQLRKVIEHSHTIHLNKQIHDAVCALIELAKIAKPL